jgi:hypothetical protein
MVSNLMKHSSRIGIALILAVVLHGCGESAETEDVAPESAQRRQLNITLDELNHSGVTGTATITAAHGRITLLIEVKAATPGSLIGLIQQGGGCDAVGGPAEGERLARSEPMQLTVAEDGSATFMSINHNWSIEPGQDESLIGRRLVLAGVDGAGGAGSPEDWGAPVSCGVFE